MAYISLGHGKTLFTRKQVEGIRASLEKSTELKFNAFRRTQQKALALARGRVLGRFVRSRTVCAYREKRR